MALLEDKVALITGAAAGIGEAVAHLFAEEGARVVALDKDEERAEAVAAAIVVRGGAAVAAQADVKDRAAVQAAVEGVLGELGRIDVLVNNAGIYPRQEFLAMTPEEWDEVHDVNLKGVFHMTQFVAAQMARQGGGKVVNVATVSFFLGYPRLSHYVSSKGGVIGLTRSLARELGPMSIHVNCVSPGAIQTEGEKRLVPPEQANSVVELQCLKRRLQPLDVARACLFLASPLSDGVTGQTLNVDGGWVLY